MKVMVAQSYFRVLDPKELERRMPYPPLGSLIAATMLRNAGHDVVFFDSMMSASPGQLVDQLEDSRPDVLMLYDDEFNYLSKMCLSNMRDAALRVIAEGVRLGCRTFVFSSDATDHAGAYLKAGADAVLTGESEETALEILDKLGNEEYDRERSGIRGLKFLQAGAMIETRQRPMVDDLDCFPDPDFDFVRLSEYKSIWQEAHGYFSINMTTTRGCPFHCNWCAKPIYGQVYHVRSPKKVVDHLEFLKVRDGIDHVWMTDDIFGLKPGWLRDFADVLASRNLRVPYKCLTRADLLLRGETVDDLKRSGCRTIWIGAESGSQEILDAMEKGTTVSQIYESTRRARRAGMEVAFFIQFGYSGELWRDIVLTRKMIRELSPEDIGISVSYPLPGTKFYERVKTELKEKTNWIDSDDLDLMCAGTYPKTFYKLLHRFVHAEYRLFRILKKMSTKDILKLPVYVFRFVLLRLKLSAFLKAAGN